MFQSQQSRKSGSGTLKRFVLIFFLAILAAHASAQEVSPDSVYQIEGISISEPLSGTGVFSTTHVQRSDIEDNIGNGSTNNMLELVPAMVTSSDAGNGVGYTNMRLRGIDNTRINVTINGVPMNDGESQGSFFVNTPALGNHVQSMQVQRGVGSSNNGALAFGATLDFTTLQPDDNPYVKLSSSAGSFLTFLNSATVNTGLIRNRFAATAAYSHTTSNGYIRNATSRLHSAFFTAKYLILNEKKNKDYGSLGFTLLYGNEKTGLAWNGVPSEFLKTDRTYNSCGLYTDADGNLQHYDNETDNYQQTHAHLTYNLLRNTGKHRIDLKVTAHLTRGIGYYEEYKEAQLLSGYGFAVMEPVSGNAIEFSDMITRKFLDNYFYGMNFNLSHCIGSQFMWMAGGAVNHYAGKHYGLVRWMQFAGNIPMDTHWYDGTGNKLQYNFFGKFVYNANRGTSIYADVQYRGINYRIGGINDYLMDVTQAYNWNFINPKAGVSHSWRDAKRLSHSVSASFAMANREPTRSDLTTSEASRRPKPETLYDLEMGYQLRHAKVAFSADGYFMYYTDQLVLTGEINNTGDKIMANAPKSFRTGIELSLTYQPARFFEWRINGAFSQNKILNFTDYVDDWDTGSQQERYIGTTDISFSPNIVASNELRFTPVKNFQVNLVTKFVSRQYLDNTSNKEYSLKPYCVSNLHLGYKIETKAISEIALFFDINNLFNSKYESNAWIYRYILDGRECRMDGFFPQAGINFMGGLSLRF